MIGTIRKHSAWLWWIIAALTIVSFIWWGANPVTRGGNGGANGGLGTLYGKPVTAEQYTQAQREFYIFYWLQNREFPNNRIGKAELDHAIYERLLLKAKAEQLGIHVSQDAQVAAANEMLRSLSGRNNQPVPLNAFIEKVLEPEQLDAADFQRFIIGDLEIQQLMQTLGLPGALVPPQEAAMLYDKQNQEVSAQTVFFSATNYLSQVTVAPAAVAQFYTNNLARNYRLPDRVQVNYIQYDLTNYLTKAELKVGKTNIADRAEALFKQHGLEAVPGAKTPEEAKAKLREMVLRQAAEAVAGEDARQFVNTLFAMDPVKPENFLAAAKSSGLTVHTTAPFSAADGPAEFAAPEELTQTAFKLNSESPFSKPIAGAESVYVIGLNKQLPSAIQPLSEIYDRVVEDYKYSAAAGLARSAATNLYINASVQMGVGKTFVQSVLAASQTPVALKPFSLSSTEIPETEGRIEADEVKQAAFSTPVGHVSPVMPTADGGFVLYVQSLLPMDETKKATALPQFMAQVRRSRENESFNLWLRSEENRELRTTPVMDELMGKTASGK